MQCSNDNDNGFTEHGSIFSAVLWPFSFGILVYVQILIQSLLLLQQAYISTVELVDPCSTLLISM